MKTTKRLRIRVGFLLASSLLLWVPGWSAKQQKSAGKTPNNTPTTEAALGSSVTAGAGGVKAGPNPAAPILAQKDAYIVGMDDELQLSVWREPDLSVTVAVRPDGMVTMPLLNDVRVVGLTTKEVQDLLTEKLAPFVNDPQVTVIVRSIRSRKVYLTGQVGHPAPYALSGQTALQLVIEGGGLTLFAKSHSIYVIRREGGREIRIPFNYKKALSGHDPKADIALLPGDVVVVP